MVNCNYHVSTSSGSNVTRLHFDLLNVTFNKIWLAENTEIYNKFNAIPMQILLWIPKILAEDRGVFSITDVRQNDAKGMYVSPDYNQSGQ